MHVECLPDRLTYFAMLSDATLPNNSRRAAYRACGRARRCAHWAGSVVGGKCPADVSVIRERFCQRLFKEKVSGAKTDRPELAKVIRRLEPDDVLVVTRLDRLARSTRDLLNVLHAVAERGAGFKSLKDAWCDTTTPHGRLMLTVLGGLAEFERELIRARTGEGRKRAKERGVRFGRPRKMTPHQRQEALQRLASGETQADIARSYNVNAATVSRLGASAPFLGEAAAAHEGALSTVEAQ